MTRKEQLAKKAARAAALATYKAITNPPVWKVAGTSFKTSPTWADIAKAAAAASYSAVLKVAQQAQEPPKDRGALDPKDFGMIGLLKQQPKPPALNAPKPTPGNKVQDIGNGPVMQKVPLNVFALSKALSFAPNFAAWVKSYGKGPIPQDVALFVDYIKKGEHKEDWATPERWQDVVDALAQQVGENQEAVAQLRAMM